MAYKPTWRDIFRPTSTKKEKRTKKERKPVETAAAVEIDKGGLRRLLLDDFHKPLEKASAQNASAFSQFQQARLLGITILRLRRRKLKRNGTYTKLRTDPSSNFNAFQIDNTTAQESSLLTRNRLLLARNRFCRPAIVFADRQSSLPISNCLCRPAIIFADQQSSLLTSNRLC